MTDKELRRLGRTELIDILYAQQKRCEELAAQNQALQAALDERALKLADVGSIAEAALRLNGVFEAAQAAAEQYLYSIKALDEGRSAQLDETQQRADEILHAAEAEAQRILSEAGDRAKSLLDEAENAAERKSQAAQDRWNAFEQRANEMLRAHEELRALSDALREDN